MRRLHHEAVVASLAWVLMPDHLHWLFQLGERRDLGSAIKLLKARSARAVNERLGVAARYGNERITITRSESRKSSWFLDGTLSPIPCVQGWSTTFDVIRCGTQPGC